jgi:acetyl-CoA carboxylase biotin carboxylase subunit
MKVLVANRGEIAIRIMRACREMNMECVAIYSEADINARHTRFADEAICVGPTNAAESYMNIPAILQAAKKSGAQAIHPGYGFLSENETFAQAVEDAGLIFIGPRPDVIHKMGNKLVARQVAEEAGLPVLKSLNIEISNPDDAFERCENLQFPVLVKAISGGGGRGIREANTLEELQQVILAASEEARAVFGNQSVYLEPLVRNARHIEVQILGDGKGKVLILGERECSIQRRHQKLVEEAPAPRLTEGLRKRIHHAAWCLGKTLTYRSLGTVEFLLDPDGYFYFIEVNPRIQVEHPVTEFVTGVDLVCAQLQLAQTGMLTLTQDDIQVRGSAIEVRVIAEIAEQDFLPDTGTITELSEPQGPGVRVDSAMFCGMEVTTDYDSMLGKLIVWANNREAAVRRMQCVMKEFRICGVKTALPFLHQIIQSEAFLNARFDTTFLDHHQPSLVESAKNQHGKLIALALAKILQAGNEPTQQRYTDQKSDTGALDPWRLAAVQGHVR